MIQFEIFNKKRRDDYSAQFYQGDYFVIKHLNKFLTSAITEFVNFDFKVCDVGCGEQPLRRKVEIRGANYLGVDVTQNSKNSVNSLVSIINLPFCQDSFDVVFCTEVLEHVSKVDQAINELSRIVKPGGIIILTIPFIYPLHEEPWDFYRLTPHQLKLLAEEAKLQLLRLQTSGNEIEVIATTWSNMWDRADLKFGIFQRMWNRLMRIPINLICELLSLLFAKSMPQKYYLNCMCILKKPTI